MIITRISREVCFMEIAQCLAKRSTCMRRAVGAVITVENRIVSTGWNGAPAGEEHCDGGFTCYGVGEGCKRAIHAEANAIKYLPRGFDNISKVMFTTESPCIACAAMMDKYNFHSLYYLNEYRLDTGIRYLVDRGTSVYRITSSGIVLKKKWHSEIEPLSEVML